MMNEERAISLLIVDDSPEDRAIIRRALSKAAGTYACIEAETGRAALAEARRVKPDSIILDYLLPDMDGLEFLTALKAQSDNTPAVVMLTGQGDEATAVKALHGGAHDYLVKRNLTSDNLRRAIDAAITKVQLEHTQADEQRRMATILESIHAGFLSADASGRIIYHNSYAATLLRWVPTPLTDHNVWSDVAGALEPGFGDVCRTVQQTGQAATWEGQCHPTAQWLSIAINPTLDGLTFYLRNTTAHHENIRLQDALFAEQAKALAIAEEYTLVLERCVHERTADLEAIVATLRQSETRFATAFNAAPVPMTITRRSDGTCDNVNTAFLGALGFAKDELIGHTLIDVVHGTLEDRLQALERTQDAGKVYTFETIYHDKHAQPRTFVVSTVTVDVLGEPCLLNSYSDVTEQRKAEICTQLTSAVTRVLNELKPLAETERRIVEALHQTLDLVYAELWLCDPQTNTLRSKAVWYAAEQNPPSPNVSANPPSESLAGRTLADAHLLWCSETSSVFITGRSDSILPDVHNAAGIPITSDTGVLGVIVCATADMMRPNQLFLDTLRGTGNQIGQYIERRQAEEARQRSEEIYRTLARNFPDSLVLLFDRDLRFLVAEGAALERNGFRREQMEGKTLYEVLPLEEQAKVLPSYHAALAGISHSFETVRGEEIYLVRAVPVTNDAGQIFAGMLVSQDITFLKQAERVLFNEKELLNVTLRSIGDGVITTDTRGQVTLVNAVAEQLIGWTQAEALGLSVETIFAITNEETGNVVPNPIRAALAQGQIRDLTNSTMLTAADGRKHLIADSAAPIRNQDGQIIGAVLVFRDVTQQKRLTEELLKASKLESLGILAGGIAHDFNNLLAAILGNISLAEMKTAVTDPIRTYLTEADKACVRAKDLTYQLLTFARGGTPVKRTSSLSQLIRDSASFALHGTPVSVNYKLAPELWLVAIDEGQITQVIQNLIINATQAMPQGGQIDVAATNVVVTDSSVVPLLAGNYVEITIADQGTGIPADVLPKIFDPYFTTKTQGNGLGLAVCYTVIKNHDGYISVESTLGKGTVFHIYLPASPMLPTIPSRRMDSIVAGSGRILVMDDDAMVRDVLCASLTGLGYSVDTAKDGESALALYQHARTHGAPYDIVVLDLTVPNGLGGKETLERLRQIEPTVKAIICSGYSNDEVVAHYAQYGFHGVIQKPFTLSELSRVIRYVLDR